MNQLTAPEMKDHQESEAMGRIAPKVEFIDPAELRVHALHKHLPALQTDSAEWHAFVDALSGAGPENTPPIYVTPEGLIMDGERRWKAARQLQWREIAVITRPEWEAALLIVESLLGQRCLTKGAKVYLSLPLLDEFRKSAETRRLSNIKRGVKNLEKPFELPKAHSAGSGKSSEALAERLGVGKTLVESAIKIRKFFDLPALREHKFEFQDGSQKTLREHFEPLILDGENPMGLGEVLKGLGWFVTPDGKPLDHVPPARNTHLFYLERAWKGWAKQTQRWTDLNADEQHQALEIVGAAAREVPVEVLVAAGRKFKEELKRRRKVEQRSQKAKG